MELERESILLYVGDFDPTGIDIDRHFEEAVNLFDRLVRVALKVEQIEELGLPENPAPQKLEEDPRRKRFIELYGGIRQVEVDAIEPDVLRECDPSTLNTRGASRRRSHLGPTPPAQPEGLAQPIR